MFSVTYCAMAYYASRDLRHTVIGPLRGLFRLLYFTVVFATGSVFALAVNALLPAATYRQVRPGLTRRLGRILLCASNIRVRRQGTPPTEGTLIVANHLSWADSFTFLGELGCRFMVNHLYGRILAFGAVLRSVGVSFVNRMSLKSIGPARTALRRVLRRGESVMVFPEGRTSRGDRVWPFRAALLQAAVDLGYPVAAAAVRYETPAGWPPASVVVGWEEWPPLILHIYRAFHAPRIVCRIAYDEVRHRRPDRRSLAATLHDRVSRLFRPMPQLPAHVLRRIDVIRKMARTIVYGDRPVRSEGRPDGPPDGLGPPDGVGPPERA